MDRMNRIAKMVSQNMIASRIMAGLRSNLFPRAFDANDIANLYSDENIIAAAAKRASMTDFSRSVILSSYPVEDRPRHFVASGDETCSMKTAKSNYRGWLSRYYNVEGGENAYLDAYNKYREDLRENKDRWNGGVDPKSYVEYFDKKNHFTVFDDHKKDGKFIIVATRDFRLYDGTMISVGTEGGMIANEKCLDQYGTCWVMPGASVEEGCFVSDHSIIGENVVLSGEVKVTGNSVVANSISGKAFLESSTISKLKEKIEIGGFFRMKNSVVRGENTVFKPSDGEMIQSTIFNSQISGKSGKMFKCHDSKIERAEITGSAFISDSIITGHELVKINSGEGNGSVDVIGSQILDRAVVSGNVRIENNSVVSDEAQISLSDASHRVRISHSHIKSNAVIKNVASIFDSIVGSGEIVDDATLQMKYEKAVKTDDNQENHDGNENYDDFKKYKDTSDFAYKANVSHGANMDMARSIMYGVDEDAKQMLFLNPTVPLGFIVEFVEKFNYETIADYVETILNGLNNRITINKEFFSESFCYKMSMALASRYGEFLTDKILTGEHLHELVYYFLTCVVDSDKMKWDKIVKKLQDAGGEANSNLATLIENHDGNENYDDFKKYKDISEFAYKANVSRGANMDMAKSIVDGDDEDAKQALFLNPTVPLGFIVEFVEKFNYETIADYVETILTGLSIRKSINKEFFSESFCYKMSMALASRYGMLLTDKILTGEHLHELVYYFLTCVVDSDKTKWDKIVKKLQDADDEANRNLATLIENKFEGQIEAERVDEISNREDYLMSLLDDCLGIPEDVDLSKASVKDGAMLVTVVEDIINDFRKKPGLVVDAFDRCLRAHCKPGILNMFADSYDKSNSTLPLLYMALGCDVIKASRTKGNHKRNITIGIPADDISCAYYPNGVVRPINSLNLADEVFRICDDTVVGIIAYRRFPRLWVTAGLGRSSMKSDANSIQASFIRKVSDNADLLNDIIGNENTSNGARLYMLNNMDLRDWQIKTILESESINEAVIDKINKMRMESNQQEKKNFKRETRLFLMYRVFLRKLCDKIDLAIKKSDGSENKDEFISKKLNGFASTESESWKGFLDLSSSDKDSLLVKLQKTCKSESNFEILKKLLEERWSNNGSGIFGVVSDVKNVLNSINSLNSSERNDKKFDENDKEKFTEAIGRIKVIRDTIEKILKKNVNIGINNTDDVVTNVVDALKETLTFKKLQFSDDQLKDAVTEMIEGNTDNIPYSVYAILGIDNKTIDKIYGYDFNSDILTDAIKRVRDYCGSQKYLNLINHLTSGVDFERQNQSIETPANASSKSIKMSAIDALKKLIDNGMYNKDKYNKKYVILSENYILSAPDDSEEQKDTKKELKECVGIVRKAYFSGKCKITGYVDSKSGGELTHRIVCIGGNVGGVKRGQLGGFVSSIENLSEGGRCWIYDDSVVGSGARLMKNAIVVGSSVVTDSWTIVTDNAAVAEGAIVSDGSVIAGNAIVADNGTVVSGETVVKDNAMVIKGSVVGDLRMKEDNRYIVKRSVIDGHAVVSGQKVLGDSRTAASGYSKSMYHDSVDEDIIDIALSSIKTAQDLTEFYNDYVNNYSIDKKNRDYARNSLYMDYFARLRKDIRGIRFNKPDFIKNFEAQNAFESESKSLESKGDKFKYDMKSCMDDLPQAAKLNADLDDLNKEIKKEKNKEQIEKIKTACNEIKKQIADIETKHSECSKIEKNLFTALNTFFNNTKNAASNVENALKDFFEKNLNNIDDQNLLVESGRDFLSSDGIRFQTTVSNVSRIVRVLNNAIVTFNDIVVSINDIVDSDHVKGFKTSLIDNIIKNNYPIINEFIENVKKTIECLPGFESVFEDDKKSKILRAKICHCFKDVFDIVSACKSSYKALGSLTDKLNKFGGNNSIAVNTVENDENANYIDSGNIDNKFAAIEKKIAYQNINVAVLKQFIKSKYELEYNNYLFNEEPSSKWTKESMERFVDDKDLYSDLMDLKKSFNLDGNHDNFNEAINYYFSICNLIDKISNANSQDSLCDLFSYLYDMVSFERGEMKIKNDEMESLNRLSLNYDFFNNAVNALESKNAWWKNLSEPEKIDAVYALVKFLPCGFNQRMKIIDCFSCMNNVHELNMDFWYNQLPKCWQINPVKECMSDVVNNLDCSKFNFSDMLKEVKEKIKEWKKNNADISGKKVKEQPDLDSDEEFHDACISARDVFNRFLKNIVRIKEYDFLVNNLDIAIKDETEIKDNISLMNKTSVNTIFKNVFNVDGVSSDIFDALKESCSVGKKDFITTLKNKFQTKNIDYDFAMHIVWKLFDNNFIISATKEEADEVSDLVYSLISDQFNESVWNNKCQGWRKYEEKPGDENPRERAKDIDHYPFQSQVYDDHHYAWHQDSSYDDGDYANLIYDEPQPVDNNDRKIGENYTSEQKWTLENSDHDFSGMKEYGYVQPRVRQFNDADQYAIAKGCKKYRNEFMRLIRKFSYVLTKEQRINLAKNSGIPCYDNKAALEQEMEANWNYFANKTKHPCPEKGDKGFYSFDPSYLLLDWFNYNVDLNNFDLKRIRKESKFSYDEYNAYKDLCVKNKERYNRGKSLELRREMAIARNATEAGKTLRKEIQNTYANHSMINDDNGNRFLASHISGDNYKYYREAAISILRDKKDELKDANYLMNLIYAFRDDAAVVSFAIEQSHLRKLLTKDNLDDIYEYEWSNSSLNSGDRHKIMSALIRYSNDYGNDYGNDVFAKENDKAYNQSLNDITNCHGELLKVDDEIAEAEKQIAEEDNTLVEFEKQSITIKELKKKQSDLSSTLFKAKMSNPQEDRKEEKDLLDKITSIREHVNKLVESNKLRSWNYDAMSARKFVSAISRQFKAMEKDILEKEQEKAKEDGIEFNPEEVTFEFGDDLKNLKTSLEDYMSELKSHNANRDARDKNLSAINDDLNKIASILTEKTGINTEKYKNLIFRRTALQKKEESLMNGVEPIYCTYKKASKDGTASKNDIDKRLRFLGDSKKYFYSVCAPKFQKGDDGSPRRYYVVDWLYKNHKMSEKNIGEEINSGSIIARICDEEGHAGMLYVPADFPETSVVESKNEKGEIVKITVANVIYAVCLERGSEITSNTLVFIVGPSSEELNFDDSTEIPEDKKKAFEDTMDASIMKAVVINNKVERDKIHNNISATEKNKIMAQWESTELPKFTKQLFSLFTDNNELNEYMDRYYHSTDDKYINEIKKVEKELYDKFALRWINDESTATIDDYLKKLNFGFLYNTRIPVVESQAKASMKEGIVKNRINTSEENLPKNAFMVFQKELCVKPLYFNCTHASGFSFAELDDLIYNEVSNRYYLFVDAYHKYRETCRENKEAADNFEKYCRNNRDSSPYRVTHKDIGKIVKEYLIGEDSLYADSFKDMMNNLRKRSLKAIGGGRDISMHDSVCRDFYNFVNEYYDSYCSKFIDIMVAKKVVNNVKKQNAVDESIVDSIKKPENSPDVEIKDIVKYINFIKSTPLSYDGANIFNGRGPTVVGFLNDKKKYTVNQRCGIAEKIKDYAKKLQQDGFVICKISQKLLWVGFMNFNKDRAPNAKQIVLDFLKSVKDIVNAVPDNDEKNESSLARLNRDAVKALSNKFERDPSNKAKLLPGERKIIEEGNSGALAELYRITIGNSRISKRLLEKIINNDNDGSLALEVGRYFNLNSFSDKVSGMEMYYSDIMDAIYDKIARKTLDEIKGGSSNPEFQRLFMKYVSGKKSNTDESMKIIDEFIDFITSECEKINCNVFYYLKNILSNQMLSRESVEKIQKFLSVLDKANESYRNSISNKNFDDLIKAGMPREEYVELRVSFMNSNIREYEDSSNDLDDLLYRKDNRSLNIQFPIENENKMQTTTLYDVVRKLIPTKGTIRDVKMTDINTKIKSILTDLERFRNDEKLSATDYNYYCRAIKDWYDPLERIFELATKGLEEEDKNKYTIEAVSDTIRTNVTKLKNQRISYRDKLNRHYNAVWQTSNQNVSDATWKGMKNALGKVDLGKQESYNAAFKQLMKNYEDFKIINNQSNKISALFEAISNYNKAQEEGDKDAIRECRNTLAKEVYDATSIILKDQETGEERNALLLNKGLDMKFVLRNNELLKKILSSIVLPTDNRACGGADHNIILQLAKRLYRDQMKNSRIDRMQTIPEESVVNEGNEEKQTPRNRKEKIEYEALNELLGFEGDENSCAYINMQHINEMITNYDDGYGFVVNKPSDTRHQFGSQKEKEEEEAIDGLTVQQQRNIGITRRGSIEERHVRISGKAMKSMLKIAMKIADDILGFDY